MKKTIFLLILIHVLFLTSLAQEENPGMIFKEKNYTFPYTLTAPEKVRKLPPKLNEISGQSHIASDSFACIQDEKGTIYLLNLNTAEIEDKINFADDGDFEGITLVYKTAWALKSSGDLYRIEDFLHSEKKHRAKKYETELSKKNDTEGLAFDKENNRLLIACKGNPYIKKKKNGKHKRAIYEFDLDKEELNGEPAFVIDLEQIKNFRDYNTLTKLGIELLAMLDENKGDVTFQPSDLAVHPRTNNIYVIGSVGDLLIVLNPSGEILAMVDLSDKLFNQPEGICFKGDGTMYISNEGGEKKATILEFKMIR